MDRKTLLDLIKAGPIRITMNDGSQHLAESIEMACVDDIAAHVLYKDPEDGKYRSHYLSLVCMVRVEPLSPAVFRP